MRVKHTELTKIGVFSLLESQVEFPNCNLEAE